MPVSRLLLDGRSGYMSVADAPAINLSGPFTVFVRAAARTWATGTTGKNILSKGGAFGSSTNYHVGIYNSQIYCDFWAGGVRRSTVAAVTSAFTEGSEHSIGFAWDGNGTLVHLDGDLTPAGTGTFGALTPNTYSDPLYIGQARSLPSVSYWDGAVREVRLYNRALTAEEIRSLHLGTADIRNGLVWEGLLNGTAADTAGGGNHGTVSGTGALFGPEVLHGIGMRGVDAWWWNRCPTTSPFAWGLSNTWSEPEQALRVSSYSSAHNGHSFLLPLERDVEYRISCKMKNVAGSWLGTQYLTLWQGDRFVVSNYVPTVINNSNWSGHNSADYADASFTFKVPAADHPSATHFTLQFVGSGTSTREIYLKDLKIEKLTQPANPARDLAPLFSDAVWVKHSDTTVSPDGETLTLNANGTYRSSYLDVSVLPGMTYVFNATHTGKITVADTAGAFLPGLSYTTAQSISFSPGHRTKVRIIVSNADLGVGTYTFTGVTLRQVQPLDVDGMDGPYSDVWGNEFSDGTLPTVAISGGVLDITGGGAPSEGSIRTRWKLLQDLDVTFEWNCVTNSVGAHGGLVLRRSNQQNMYAMLFTPITSTSYSRLHFWRRLNGTWQSAGNTNTVGFSPVVNTFYMGRVQVIGSAFKAKMWERGSAEPAEWQFTAIDTNHTVGAFGVYVYGSTRYKFDNIKENPIGTPGFFDELVINGDFSAGTTGWSNVGSGTFNVVNGQGELTAAANNDTVMATSNIVLMPNTRYRLTGIKDQLDADFQLGIRARDAGGNFVSTYPTFIAGPSGFVEFNTGQYPYWKPFVAATANGVGKKVTFDNISLKRYAP